MTDQPIASNNLLDGTTLSDFMDNDCSKDFNDLTHNRYEHFYLCKDFDDVANFLEENIKRSRLLGSYSHVLKDQPEDFLAVRKILKGTKWTVFPLIIDDDETHIRLADITEIPTSYVFIHKDDMCKLTHTKIYNRKKTADVVREYVSNYSGYLANRIIRLVYTDKTKNIIGEVGGLLLKENLYQSGDDMFLKNFIEPVSDSKMDINIPKKKED